MRNRHYSLLKSLMNVGALKKEFKNSRGFAKSFTPCKEFITDCYRDAISDLMVATIFFITNMDEQYTEEQIEGCCDASKDMLEGYFVSKLKRRPVSKMLFFFNFFRLLYEKSVFAKLKEDVRLLYSESKEPHKITFNRMMTRLEKLTEFAMLFLSGIGLNCDNIKDLIFEEKIYDGLTPLGKCCSSVGKEQLTIFITEEMDDSEAIINTMGRFFDYHTSVEDINVILDYKTHPIIKFQDRHVEIVKLFMSAFKDTRMVNCGHLEFGEFAKDLPLDRRVS